MNENIEQNQTIQKKPNNIKTIIIIVVVSIASTALMFGLLFLLIKININNSINKAEKERLEKEKELRKWVSLQVPYELADKGLTKKCYQNCKYFGNYPLKDDLTYHIVIKEDYDGIDEVFYKDEDKEKIENRKKIYNYIKEQKGDRFVPNYLLAISTGGEDGFEPDEGERCLSYIVYEDSTMNLDEQIESDYKIVKMVSKLDPYLKRVNIYYINDERIRNENWLEELGIEVDDYYLAPAYLDGDDEISTDKFTYYYAFTDYNKTKLPDMSLAEYKKYAYENLERQ